MEPGIHGTGGHNILGSANAVYLGGYTSALGEATVDGNGGSGFLESNQGATGGIVEYLTIDNFLSDQNSAVLGGNSGSGGSIAIGWTYEYDTVGPNEIGPSGSGQNSDGGYGIIGGSNTTIEYNCLTQNAQGAFNIPGGVNASNTSPTILTGDVVSHNEISSNGLGTYPDIPGNPYSCGCSGGGKAFWTLNMQITYNYVHDNYNNGIWLDFNNAGANISHNYISSNWGWGIYYEASYNANISDNTLVGNGWASDGSWPTSSYCSTIDPTYNCADGQGPSSKHWGNESAGAILVVDSGGNTNIAGSNYSGEVLVEDNLMQNNWSGVDLYTDDSRFSGGPYQCNAPLQDTNSTYYQQWNQASVGDGVTNGTTTITSSGGFTQLFQPSGNYCSPTGPSITPGAGWYVYDSAGKIPAGDTISSCSSANSCTLTKAVTGSTTGDYIVASEAGGCGYADLIGSSEGNTSGSPAADYWDNCLWGTRNVTVSGNTFSMASASVTGCTAAAYCGNIEIINSGAGFPANIFDIYDGNGGYFENNAPNAQSPLNNVFSNNTYTWTGSAGPGAWQFVTVGSGNYVSHNTWINTYHQDNGSTGL